VSIIIILLIITGGFSEKLEILLFSFSVASSLAIVQIQLSILRAEFKAKSYAFLAISSTGIPLLVTNFFSLYGSRDLLLPFATSVLIVAGILQLKTLFIFPNYKNIISIVALVAIGYPMIFHSVAISLFQYGDKLAGYLGLGSELVAEITITSLFMTAPMLLLSSINNAWILFFQQSK
jgi:hypothetical protein